MSRLTFISNANATTAGAITASPAGVSGVWDVTAGAFNATILAANDVVEVVQGTTVGYPVFSQIFEMNGVKRIYRPWTAPVLGRTSITITAVAAGTVHSFKIVRRASDIAYSNMINGTTDFGRTDQVTPIEYVEVAGDTATSIATALAAAVNKLGKTYGFLAMSVAGVVSVYANAWGTEYELKNILPVTNTALVIAKVEGSGNYWQVLSAEKETQAMAGYHSRAGSFLNTPATYTSTTLAANPAIVAGALPTVPTTGYDCITLMVPNASNDAAISRENKFTELSIYVDDTAANSASFATQFGYVNGTASTLTF